jgi:hypothetical protein
VALFGHQIGMRRDRTIGEQRLGRGFRALFLGKGNAQVQLLSGRRDPAYLMGTDPAGGKFPQGLNQGRPHGKRRRDRVDWHRKRIAENRTLLDELEAGNEAGDEVFPETRAEIERLEAQIEQSELIVAAHEKQIAPK